jgi:hypothetical protein
VPEFVVEVDRDLVGRSRAIVLRARRVSAVVSSVAGGLIIVVAIGVFFLVGWSEVWLLALMGVAGLLLAGDGQRRFVAMRRLRQVWQAVGIVPVALRFGVEGLHWSPTVLTSFFLPWAAVGGFRLTGTLGQQSLVLDLMPGVTAHSPGVLGLEPLETLHARYANLAGFSAFSVGVRTLRQPLPQIDQALVHFTQGRLRLH